MEDTMETEAKPDEAAQGPEKEPTQEPEPPEQVLNCCGSSLLLAHRHSD